jgi:DNA adenine methylase
MTPTIKTKAIANWFGSNRLLAATVGAQLGELTWCAIPFAGGCSELPYIKTRTGIASDLHRHLVNLARVIRNDTLQHELARRLEATLYHPDELAAAQDRCSERESANVGYGALFGMPEMNPDRPADHANVDWAYDYFLCTWMTGGGRSGTSSEFNQSMSFRWGADGGDSCGRFRSAAESFSGWFEAMRPWNFIVQDAISFLGKIKNAEGYGCYADAPWPDDGDGYKHGVDDYFQRTLAKDLTRFKKTRVVVRFGDHPLIRELYPESHWNWVLQSSRAQSNGEVKEVLIINGKSKGVSV